MTAALSPVKRPLVRWYGGKWRLAPTLLKFFPPHRIYAEPFGGGGSMLLRKPRAYAEVWNDLDGEAGDLLLAGKVKPEGGKKAFAWFIWELGHVGPAVEIPLTPDVLDAKEAA